MNNTTNYHILSQRFIKEFSIKADDFFLKEVECLIKTFTSKQIRNSKKIIINFINNGITDWVDRIEKSKFKKVGSRDRFVSLYGVDVGEILFEKSNSNKRNKMKEMYFKSVDHLLKQKPFLELKSLIKIESRTQLESVILKFKKKYILNNRKEVVQNMIKYNVDGNWVDRLIDGEKFKNDGFSLEALTVKYGESVAKTLFGERLEKVKCKRENYTENEWSQLCDKKKSNLGLDGYVKKYGEVDGRLKWNTYSTKWRLGIEKRKLSGMWKNGQSLSEYQDRYGIKDGYDLWKRKSEKRNHTLSLRGFIERFGDFEGKFKYYTHIDKMIKNCRSTSACSKISQEMFHLIYMELNEEQKLDCKYSTLNEEQSFFVNESCGIKSKIIYVDFKCKNVIIEFDGEYWHSFPSVIHNDNCRNTYLTLNGYKILRITESDFKKDKKTTVMRCKDFINKNYERT